MHYTLCETRSLRAPSEWIHSTVNKHRLAGRPIGYDGFHGSRKSVFGVVGVFVVPNVGLVAVGILAKIAGNVVDTAPALVLMRYVQSAKRVGLVVVFPV